MFVICSNQCMPRNQIQIITKTNNKKQYIEPKYSYKMTYCRPIQHSISVSQQSQFSQQCPICTSLDKGLILWIRGNLYAKENNYYGRFMKITNNILQKRPGKYVINFKEAMIQANYNKMEQFQYKKFNQIIQEIKQSITVNIYNHKHYDKLYFGDSNYQTMLKYQIKKKALLNAIQNNQNNNSSKFKPKFKVNTKSAVSTDSQDKILQDSTLNKKYDFYPVQEMQRHEKSKFEMSQFQIQKLKKNLSIMIGQLKVSQETYPQTKDLTKPYIDFIKTKEELKFRKKLENNISQIHQEKQRNRLKKSQHNIRLYTTPDPQDDCESQYRYGLLFQQNPQLKKKKRKSLLRKQASKDKSAANLSRTKLINNNNYNNNKASRQVTQQGSHLIIQNSSTTINWKKSKSKYKLKGSCKNKLLLARSSSRGKLKGTSITMDKSVSKRKKLLMQYKG